MDAGRARIAVSEPAAERCPRAALPPEGNVKLRNYRVLNENLRAYTPTGDVHTSPGKGKLVPRFDVYGVVSPPRARILELLRPEDPGREALEAIVRPAPRRGLARPLDEDARRFLQRALLSPSPYLSDSATPEPLPPRRSPTPEDRSRPGSSRRSEEERSPSSSAGISLADELREAEEEERAGGVRPEPVRENLGRGSGGAGERERLGRLALAVEEDEPGAGAGLCAAGRRLDALLAESRALHVELAGIQADLQAQAARAARCAAAAAALGAEARALRFLDDVLALLRGDERAAARAAAWPFARHRRLPARNYVV